MHVNTSLRHQLVLPGQCAVYDHWRAACQGDRLPARHDIDPTALAPHLPMISLLKIEGDRHRMRLAGTGFWDLYGREVQGRYLDEMLGPDRLAYWRRVLAHMVTHRSPANGAMRSETPLGAHLTQYWLRLPLATNGVDVDMILGFDVMAKAAERVPQPILPRPVFA